MVYSCQKYLKVLYDVHIKTIKRKILIKFNTTCVKSLWCSRNTKVHLSLTYVVTMNTIFITPNMTITFTENTKSCLSWQKIISEEIN